MSIGIAFSLDSSTGAPLDEAANTLYNRWKRHFRACLSQSVFSVLRTIRFSGKG
jgi:hypothetical protein